MIMDQGSITAGAGRRVVRKRHRYREGMLWGLVFIGLGVAFLVDQLDYFDLWRMWEWWPLIGVVWGVSRIIAWTSADDVGSAVTWTLIALWVMTNTFEWFGLEWSNSWPLVLVAIGTGMVTTAALRPAFGRTTMASGKEENGHA
jgi:hypothetical protein